MTAIDRLLREDLRGRRPYGAPQHDVPVRLNTNESPYPLPAPVIDAVTRAVRAELAGLHRYPDRDAMALRTELAAHLGHGLDASRVWAANGSNEVQQQLLQAFGGPGREVLGFGPSYSMHPILAAATGTGWIEGARDAELGLDAADAAGQVRRHRPHLVFLCSPNNPTGAALPAAVLEAVVAAAPGLVVVDEAYVEFARPGTGTGSALELLARHPRLVVTRTMSKAAGFAGGRLGYLVAAPEVVEALRLVRLPYHLSSLTQAAARAVLEHAGELAAAVDRIRAERDRIVTLLRDRGVPVADSDANFVLVGGLGDEQEVWRALLERGVLVRDVGLPGRLRVTAGTPQENDAFLAALAKVLEER